MAKTWKTVLIGLLLVLLSFTVACDESTLSSLFPTEDPTPKNTYASDAFYTEDGFLRYEDAPHLVGLDVSVYQGIIDWQAVAEDGAEFVIIRAGYRGSTQGLLYEDEQFRYNLQGAKEAGLLVGVYFFSQAMTPAEAEDEASFVCQLLDDTELDLPIFYDWEHIGGRIASPDEVPLNSCARRFCQIVEEQGYQSGIYFNQTLGTQYFNLREWQEYTLWLAEYNPTPGFPYHFDCLQYTDSGTIDGIEGPVDLDILWLPQS